MKHLRIIIPALLFCICTSAQLVVHVYDGDTYRIFHKGKFQIVRLANVDAPELSQYYGKIVKNEVSSLLLTKPVSLTYYGKDRYGRQLAKVTVGQISVDSFLLSKGWAWYWKKYSHDIKLGIVADMAKRAKQGMWRCDHNIPPWVWRQLIARQKRLKEMCR